MSRFGLLFVDVIMIVNQKICWWFIMFLDGMMEKGLGIFIWIYILCIGVVVIFNLYDSIKMLLYVCVEENMVLF